MAARSTFQKSFNLKVIHNQAAGIFYVSTLDGPVELKYHEDEQGIWDLQEVRIPTQARPLKIAPRLIEYVLEKARKSGHDIKASCPVVKSFLARNPYYAMITVK